MGLRPAAENGDADHGIACNRIDRTGRIRRGCYSSSMKPMLALLLALSAAPLSAETLVVGDQVQLRESKIEVPARGSSMTAVEARFGAPRTRHEAVGKPPITRWDYDGFSVYFEYQHVVHSVAQGG
jgi:hypothetical protein